MLVVTVALVAPLLELLLGELLPGQPHPSMVLLAAISVGMLRSTRAGVGVAFLGGLALDSLAPPFGRQTLPLVLAVLPVFLKHTELARRTVLAPVVAVALGSAVNWVALGLVDSILGLSVPWAHVLLRWLLPSVLLNALLALPAYALLSRLPFRGGLRLTTR